MSRPLHVALPTRDGTAEIATVLALPNLGALLGRAPRIHVSEAGNIPRARNQALRTAEADDPADPLWVLWLDSDIRFVQGTVEALARYIARADQEGMGFAAHYRRGDGGSTFARGYGTEARMLDMEEVEALADWVLIDGAGLGCAYLPMPRGYIFRADEWGEDMHLWEDLRLPLRYAKGVPLIHHRMAML